jgi:RsiW-degrading membrane proteinase PrsW (M82 family)
MPALDPVQRADDDSRDLQDVVYWEPRSHLDAVAVRLHGALLASGRVTVVLLAVLIVGAQFLLTAAATLAEPAVGVYILLSVVPALGLAAYIWRTDVTVSEPGGMLVVTFLLGFLFAGFAAVLNSSLSPLFGGTGIGLVLFFFLVVGPVEETVKWLAIRLYAYRSPRFGAVVDGAVYGAMAGLGFATIENSLYITEQYLTAAQAGVPVGEATFRTAAVRTLAGPGHVLYSAFAGYYLGLAKFNAKRRGPIVVKGLLVAALLHATYNTLVSGLPLLIEAVPALAALGTGTVFVGFVVAFDGVVGYALYRKLARYRASFQALNADRAPDRDGVERTEFDPATRGTEVGAGTD